MAKKPIESLVEMEDTELEAEEEDDPQNWDDWEAEEEEDGDLDSNNKIQCLFCDSNYTCSDDLFQHCRLTHSFDFRAIRNTLALDFYASFKLINYVRSQVAENRCWNCGLTCKSEQELQAHLHENVSYEVSVLPWDDNKYLKPFMQDDPLLYSFTEDEEGEDEEIALLDKEELLRDLNSFETICMDDDNALQTYASHCSTSCENARKEVTFTHNHNMDVTNPTKKVTYDSIDVTEDGESFDGKPIDNFRGPFTNIVAKEMKNVNRNYFGSYSSFGIHREMISDKVRTDAYKDAILNNPCLLRGAVVLDVGCGTGILSLFAAQAGASRVIAVEASDKMAVVATQIARDNGLLWKGANHCDGVIRVVQGMVEELSEQIQPHSVDILLSEWMGYCLLYETMLSSVLFARDRWLKPGGAILPDTATIFVAGFGKGGTSIPFWENVYGFNMSCIGKELVEDAARVPIVDVIDSRDIVTNSAVLQTFDLAVMKAEEMDFTARVELESKLNNLTNNSPDSKTQTLCYGVVLWFETGFTSRFCKEMPIVLSTSPYTPATHWSQTILTFQEPILMASANSSADSSAAVGTDARPAVKILLRISIARSSGRSIDISLETAGISPDGRKHSWPVQMFNL